MAKIEWLSVKQAVDLTGTSEKTIRRKAKSKKYRSKYVKGTFGKELRLAKEDVMKDVQAIPLSGHEVISPAKSKCCDLPPGHPQTPPIEEKPSSFFSTLTPPAPLRVLLAEDSEEMIKVLTALFTKLNVEIVGVVSDGSDALKKMVVDRPDLVITEMALPGMDGFHLSKTVAEQKEIRDIPLVFLSYLRDSATVKSGRDCPGVREYFRKPLIGSELKRFRDWIKDFRK